MTRIARLTKQNDQKSLRRVRPAKTASFLKGSKCHFIIPSFYTTSEPSPVKSAYRNVASTLKIEFLNGCTACHIRFWARTVPVLTRLAVLRQEYEQGDPPNEWNKDHDVPPSVAVCVMKSAN